MLRACVLDFQGQWSKYIPLVEFSYNNSYQATIGMAPYEALYGRKCRSPVHWDEERQKSYSNQRRRMLEFSVGDQVFLKVAPMKGVMRFGKKGKLSPRYIGPFHITERIGDVAYRLDLPASMSQIHDVFHVSMLRKYVANPSHILTNEPIEVKTDLSYEEIPVGILLREVKKLRNKEIPLVKVLWRNQSVEEAAWEREDEMRAKYPDLFR
ncbi:hypothetical protein DH2020_013161 [Rehmannia glutinosa]|uniref:Tf2-1-like SH3-like domain-containing protein n=1 Tax=Rehmannia glutinosa TaxID=99300 RepID=A0ABR0X4L6_REHGL